MDIHPILVHVPIAFLSVYAILEISSFLPNIRKSSTVFTLKSFLLGIGFIGAVVAASAGDNALMLNRNFLNKNIVEYHEQFAGATEALFALLTVIYFTMIVTRYKDVRKHILKNSLHATEYIEKIGVFFFRHFYITALLAVIGLILVTITAGFGGALVFGTDSADPFIRLIVETVCGIECM